MSHGLTHRSAVTRSLSPIFAPNPRNRQTPWSRPTDWPVLPTVLDTDSKFTGLFAVFPGDLNYVAVIFATSNGTGYSVDWGDGTTTTYASGAIASRQYTYSSVTSAVTARGWKPIIITVTPVSSVFSTFSLNQVHPSLTNTTYAGQWIDISFAGSSLTACTFNGAGNFPLKMLENIRIGTLGTNGIGQGSFNGLGALRNIERIVGGVINSLQSMFEGCTSLQSIPPFNIASGAATNADRMFYGCNSLVNVPLLNFSGVSTMTSVFRLCTSLQTIPLIKMNTTAGNNVDCTFMFLGCSNLVQVPLLDLSRVTNANGMFQDCVMLQTVPNFNLAVCTTMSSMFSGCTALISVPAFTAPLCTGISSMFNNCVNLRYAPAFTFTAGVTSFSSIFTGCTSLAYVPDWDWSTSTSNSAIFSSGGNNSVNYFRPIGIKVTWSFSGGKYHKVVLEDLMTAMGIATAGNSVTISTNPGATSATATVGTTIGSATATATVTSAMAVGMYITGVGIDTHGTVTADVVANTFTRTAHGLANGTPVAFSGLASVTGITADTVYYVVATAANTFQIALTVGGAAIDITGTNSSPTLVMAVTIDATANTLSRTAHGLPNGTQVSLRILNVSTGIAINTMYYVVNTAADTFQIALTAGGAAIDITGSNGTGILRYSVTITAIAAATNITLSVPAFATNSITATFSVLNRDIARHKNWTVAG